MTVDSQKGNFDSLSVYIPLYIYILFYFILFIIYLYYYLSTPYLSTALRGVSVLLFTIVYLLYFFLSSWTTSSPPHPHSPQYPLYV